MLKSCLQQRRSFVNARVKWVGDPDLDEAVEREKNLKQLISVKDRIVSSPSKSLPLSSLSLLLKPPLVNLPITAAAFLQKNPSVFTIFQPSPSLPLHVRLTREALMLHKEEVDTIHLSESHRNHTVQRLAKLLLLTKARTLPLYVVDRFRFDLGLPHDYITSLIGDFPDYFEVIEIKDRFTGENTLALSLTLSSQWNNDLAVSELQRRERETAIDGLHIRYSMNFPKGYELDKRVKNWLEQWQNLPYISPYENAFHLGSFSDQAEKWTVAVIHELLCLLVSKKTETENVFCLGEYLGFGRIRLKNALVHHPGIFYMSHKIRTQTVVLREGFRKGFLIEKHPLMGMRHRYIYLMSKSQRGVKKRSETVNGKLREATKLKRASKAL